MKLTTRLLHAVILLAVLVSMLVVPGSAVAQQEVITAFSEEFSGPTLDPAWEVVEFPGPRSHGYPLPANHFSLAAAPGFLRYYVDPMTYPEGFLSGFITPPPDRWGYRYDPGLELRRTFGGDQWTLETKVQYYMPFSNYRAFELRVYFGDGGPGTVYLNIQRVRDGPWPSGTPEAAPVFVNLVRMIAPHNTPPRDRDVLETASLPPTSADLYYYRIQRAGGVLSAQWSADGMTWTTLFERDMGPELDELAQRVVVVGGSWFTPANSYADYDYIRLIPTNRPPICSNATPSISLVWPANHQWAPVSVQNIVDPDGDAVMTTIASIWQDEPVDSAGDGRFAPDAKGIGTALAEVRAERAGTPKAPGDGRVYHIRFTASDGRGGSCSGEVQVAVPHDQAKPAVDGGALFDSTQW